MKSFTCFKTESNNHYIYNSLKRQSVYCHPILAKIIIKWLRNPKTFCIKELYDEEVKCDKKAIDYYYYKFKYLLKNDFLNIKEIKAKVLTKIPQEIIEKAIGNTEQILFEVTESCNLNCQYCGYGDLYWDHDKRTNAFLDEKIAIALLTYLKSLWSSVNYFSHNKSVIISFYGGEPLLNFPFIQNIVEYVEKLNLKHIQFGFSITTNGILLKRYIGYFMKHDFSLTISLDGDKEMNGYRLFHDGTSSYDIVYNNILLIKNEYPEYYRKKVKFHAVIHNRNNLESIIYFFDKTFNKVPRVLQLNSMGIVKNKMRLFAEMYNSATESISNATDIHYIREKMGVDYPNIVDKITFLNFSFDNTFWKIQDLFELNNDKRFSKIPTGTCFPFSKKVFLTAKGKILPCEKIGHQYSLGNVSENEVELNIENVVQLYMRYFSKLKLQCETCYKFSSCRQCIFNIKSLEDVNPVCEGFIDHLSFHNHIADCFQFFEEEPKMYEKSMQGIIKY